jgi:hypothetical protein
MATLSLVLFLPTTETEQPTDAGVVRRALSIDSTHVFVVAVAPRDVPLDEA